jgi:acyl-coenzyme A thioesterase PaaI-like protein
LSALDIIEALTSRSPALERGAATLAIPRILPVTRGLGLKVVALDDDGCDLRLPFSKKAKNHVGGMYLGVLLIAAEVSMALYVLRLLRGDRFSVLVKGTRSAFRQQSKEPVIARCRPAAELRSRVLAARDLAPGDKAAFTFDVDVLFERTLDGADADATMGQVSFDVSAMRRRPR